MVSQAAQHLQCRMRVARMHGRACGRKASSALGPTLPLPRGGRPTRHFAPLQPWLLACSSSSTLVQSLKVERSRASPCTSAQARARAEPPLHMRRCCRACKLPATHLLGSATVQLAQVNCRLSARHQSSLALPFGVDSCTLPAPTWGSSVLPSGSYTVLCTLRSQQGGAKRTQHAVGREGLDAARVPEQGSSWRSRVSSASKHGQHQAAPGTTLLFVCPPAGCHSHLQCGLHGQVALRIGVEGLGVIRWVLQAGRERAGTGGDVVLTTCRPLPPAQALG